MTVNIRPVSHAFCALFLLLQVACAISPDSKSRSRGIYALAKLESVEEITTYDNSISIDGTYRLNFIIKDTIFGSTMNQRYYYIRKSAEPVAGRDYYILIMPDQVESEIVWVSPASLGFCDGREAAAKFGVELAYQRLERQHPCRK